MPRAKITYATAKPYSKACPIQPRIPRGSTAIGAKKESSPSSETNQSELEKDIVLQIILTKLESSKTCDWHELSQRLSGAEGMGVFPAARKANGGKGKPAKKDTTCKSGTELHDLYHNTILPALRSGRALWRSSPIPSDGMPTTPKTNDIPLDENEINCTEDGIAMSKARRFDRKSAIKAKDVDEDDIDFEGESELDD